MGLFVLKCWYWIAYQARLLACKIRGHRAGGIAWRPGRGGDWLVCGRCGHEYLNPRKPGIDYPEMVAGVVNPADWAVPEEFPDVFLPAEKRVEAQHGSVSACSRDGVCGIAVPLTPEQVAENRRQGNLEAAARGWKNGVSEEKA